MRIEFEEKIQDLTEEEKDHRDRMGIEPRDRRYKWRRVSLWLDFINSVFEANDKETILEYGDLLITVKGSYDEITSKIAEAES